MTSNEGLSKSFTYILTATIEEQGTLVGASLTS